MSATLDSNTLRLNSVPESINYIENLVSDIRDELALNDDTYGNMLVALTEAVTNAIYHGNKGDEHKSIDVSYYLHQDCITFCVGDEGVGFDYYNIPDPTSPDRLDQANGRGLFLMKHLADQVIFSDKGRTVELYFKIA